MASKLVFIAGVAEAKSKGRGEECISQNLRILQGQNGKQLMLFFANSQRRELKRYVSIPINCIDSVNPGKKAGRPVVLQLQPNFDLLSQMKVLQIQFLDDSGEHAIPVHNDHPPHANTAQTESDSANSSQPKKSKI